MPVTGVVVVVVVVVVIVPVLSHRSRFPSRPGPCRIAGSPLVAGSPHPGIL
jgi:hypothetical protein